MDPQLEKKLQELSDAHVAEMQALKDGNAEKMANATQSIETLKTELDGLKTAISRAQIGDLINEKAEEDAEIKQFVAYAKNGAFPQEHKDLSVGVDANGGYLVPEKLQTAVTKLLREQAPLRGCVDVVQLSGTDRFPFNRQLTEADAGWVAETGTRSNTSTPTFDRVEIVAHELYANPKLTLQVIEDSNIDLATWLADDIARDMAVVENAAFTSGTGSDQPFGLITRTDASGITATPASISRVNLASAGTITHDDLVKIVHTIKPQYRANAKWVMNRATLEVIRGIKDSAGRPIYDHDYAYAEGFKSTILGYEVVENEDMPDVGNSGSPEVGNVFAIFGDFMRGYRVFDRKEVTILRDPYSSKGFVEFYTRKRVGGDVNDGNALVALANQ